jgi:hypothetical protein
MASNDNGNELDAALRAKVDEVKARRAAEIPPGWFVDALCTFAIAVMNNTARTKSFELHVSSELGLVIGIAPGEHMQVHTAVGYVTVVSDSNPATTSL